MAPLPESIGGPSFEGAVRHFMGKTNPRTNKPYTKEEASAIVATIEKRIEK